MMLRLGWLCGCGLAGPLAADELTLDGGGRLTGTVRSINEASVVELISELSPQPVLLKRGAVAKVTFSSNGVVPKPPAALVELSNGDLLPATLEALDDRKLTITSPQAGRLEIPREALKSLQLGIQQRNVVYAGPHDLNEWTGDDDTLKNWVCEHDGLIANGPAQASKKFALPEQFILRLTLKWQPKQIPNFQIYFADPLLAKGERCDRYYLQFGGAGLEIKREAAKGKRFNTIIQLNRAQNLYPGQQLQVEVRVDRKGSRLHLLLNDEPEGDFIDPIAAVPNGSGITLVSNVQNGNPQEFRDIQVLEFDDARGRHRAELRGDPKTDSLISREDDRWSGHLLELRNTDDGPLFLFKSDFQQDALEIREADVSTVFFATRDGKAPDPQPHPFILRLRGEGSLRVASCLFTEETVSAVHPLLGPLTLRRDGIVAMERSVPKADPTTKSAPEP
jgi:hypothetical protein